MRRRSCAVTIHQWNKTGFVSVSVIIVVRSESKRAKRGALIVIIGFARVMQNSSAAQDTQSAISDLYGNMYYMHVNSVIEEDTYFYRCRCRDWERFKIDNEKYHEKVGDLSAWPRTFTTSRVQAKAGRSKTWGIVQGTRRLRNPSESMDWAFTAGVPREGDRKSSIVWVLTIPSWYRSGVAIWLERPVDHEGFSPLPSRILNQCSAFRNPSQYSKRLFTCICTPLKPGVVFRHVKMYELVLLDSLIYETRWSGKGPKIWVWWNGVEDVEVRGLNLPVVVRN